MRQQYKITLGDELRTRLDAASATSGRPVSEEIRDRLERSLEADQFDQPTRELSELVFELAREAELELGLAWHANGVAHRTFRRMLLRAISKWRPADYNDNLLDHIRLEPMASRPLASHPVSDADALGVALADDVLNTPDRDVRDRIRTARKGTLQEILRLHANKGEDHD